MRKRNFFKDAGILLIAITLLLSTAITGITQEEKKETINPAFLRTENPNPYEVENNQPLLGSELFQQLPFEPEESWIFYTSDLDAGYRVHDEYWDVDKSICDIHWWGLSLVYPWSDCDPEGMEFEIIFWDSLLGNKICEYEVSPTAEATGKYYAGFEMYYWETFLDPCCEQIPDGWVSIQSSSSTNDCWFLWAGSDEGDLYCYQEGTSEPDQDTDAAFELTGGCNGSIDVEKYVWDPCTQDWVDADIEDDALDLPICSDAYFRIDIHNDGCCPIFNINVTDIMNDSLEYIDSDPEPASYEYNPPNYYIYWYFSDPLNPGDTITINITAHVVGPDCSIDLNFVEVGASSDCEPNYVTDEDYTYIHCFENDPPLPPIINGPQEGRVGEETEFIISATDPDGNDIYFYIDWGDGNVEEWVGPYASEQNIIIGHTWYNEGEFLIMVKAKDCIGYESDWETFSVTIVPDPPPTAPTIDGPTSGKPGIEYSYKFNAEDPDGDLICYFVDWGDGTNTGWTAYFNSGADVTFKHIWSTEGEFNIVAKAKNIDGLVGPEATFTVNIPRYRINIFNFNLINWLFERFSNILLIRYLLGMQ